MSHKSKTNTNYNRFLNKNREKQRSLKKPRINSQKHSSWGKTTRATIKLQLPDQNGKKKQNKDGTTKNDKELNKLYSLNFSLQFVLINHPYYLTSWIHPNSVEPLIDPNI